MKVSDFIASFLAARGIRQVFIISGGASIHILHSLATHTGIEPICPHHEQAGAMAADGYARVVGDLGCAVGTSGPGATNLITGIAGAWFDSVPVLYITGQVATYRMRGSTGVRQLGFQETDILSMVGSITKHAVQISNPLDIKFELEKAAYIATHDRPGPVVIDIPDDLQRQMINVDELRSYEPPPLEPRCEISDETIDALLSAMSRAQRPVIVFGWGIRLAGAVELARTVASRIEFPILTSWAAKDMIEFNHPLLAGTFGTHGTRAGNFTVQNADFILSVGARLSTHETGTPLSTFARAAQIAIVDIDPAELGKFAEFGKKIDYPVNADARDFLLRLLSRLDAWKQPDITSWRTRICAWAERYKIRRLTPAADAVDPYALMDEIASIMAADEHVFIDTGCAIAWAMQAFPVRDKQRLFHDFNNTAMGWALPAAIGGSLALDRRPVTCIVGDGSLMMNLQELATVQQHKLPIRIIVLNNSGYGMVQQTEEQWLDGKFVGTSIESGLGFPDLPALSEAFGIPHDVVATDVSVSVALKSAYAIKGPVLVDVRISSKERVTPQARYGYPIEDSDPLLPRDEFMANMIVAPLPKSLEAI